MNVEANCSFLVQSTSTGRCRRAALLTRQASIDSHSHHSTEHTTLFASRPHYDEQRFNPPRIPKRLALRAVMPFPRARITALQQKIWDGTLPLEIRLATSDCRTYSESDPYLVQYPRLSYLAFLLPRLHAFFASNLINPEVPAHEAWLDFEGVPLKWHNPLGLLYDLYSGAEPVHLQRQAIGESVEGSKLGSGSGLEGGNEGVSPLPWRLTVHYSEFPGDQLIQLDAEGRAMLDTFINAVKEADFIRNGTARTVMSLSMEDSDKLWKSVQTRKNVSPVIVVDVC